MLGRRNSAFWLSVHILVSAAVSSVCGSTAVASNEAASASCAQDSASQNPLPQGQDFQKLSRALAMNTVTDDLVDVLKKETRPIELGRLAKKARVLYFGESHTDRWIKDFLIRGIPELKAHGVTHLGIEALESSDQPVLDRFMAGTATNEEVLERLNKNWGWMTSKYLDVLIVARTAGLKIVALDLPGHRQLNIRHDKQMTKRDEHMAKTIADSLHADQNSKMTVLAGSEHVKCCSSVSQRHVLQERFGISSYGINVDDPKNRKLDWQVSSTYWDETVKLGEAYDRSGLNREVSLEIPRTGSKSLGSFDAYIFQYSP